MELTENMKRAVAALVATRKWSEASAIRGLLAEGRCEYCDRDLLASIDAYKAWEADHIVPLSAGGTDDLDNRALACRSCNVGFKGRWNPASVCREGATRADLIAATRAHIQKKREAFESEVDRTAQIFVEYYEAEAKVQYVRIDSNNNRA
jgi:5-methylcytosine-specific restriction endonuclease McrA